MEKYLKLRPENITILQMNKDVLRFKYISRSWNVSHSENTAIANVSDRLYGSGIVHLLPTNLPRYITFPLILTVEKRVLSLLLHFGFGL